MNTDYLVDQYYFDEICDEKYLISLMNKIEEEDKEILFKLVLKISIKGIEYDNYDQQYILHKDTKMSIRDIMKKYGIISRASDSTYKGFTFNRLIRIFRNQLNNFYRLNNCVSYLWFKYSDRDEKMKLKCYPGYEYILTNENDFIYLLTVYKKLDKHNGTSLHSKIKSRVESIKLL